MEKTSSLNAVIYTRFSSVRNAERFSEYERQKGILYCAVHGYNVCAVLQSTESNALNDFAVNKIMESAEQGKVDVLVLTSVVGFPRYQEDTFRFFDRLHGYGVIVERIGCDSPDRGIAGAYIEECNKQEKAFQEMLEILVK